MADDKEDLQVLKRHQSKGPQWRKHVLKRFPILAWFPVYSRGDLIADMIAGITVGLTVVPQSMAYAAIAGLSPEYGLYSAYIGCFLYVILGGCRQVTIGPTAVMGLLTFEVCGSDFPSCAILTAFYAGILELSLAILQLGWIVNFISEPVVTGFTSGAATTIMSSQVKSFLGLGGPKGQGFLGYWKAIIRDIGTINWADCCMGWVSLTALLLLRRLKDYKCRSSSRKKALWFVSVSRNVLVVLITTLISYLWPAPPPFKLTGLVHGGFPPVAVPSFVLSVNSTSLYDPSVEPSFSATWSLLGAGPVIVALIAILQNVAISKAFGAGQSVDATQEMFALGIANILGSFFSSIPISGSFSRSAVNESSGVRSPMGGLFTAVLVLLSLGFLTQSFYYIPKASLAAVIISAVIFMIEYEAIPLMWQINKMDAVICLVTYFSSITLGMEIGIISGSALSLTVVLMKLLKPKMEVTVATSADTREKYIYSKLPPGIHFPSVDHVRSQLTKMTGRLGGTAGGGGEVDLIVLDLKEWTCFDYSAILAVASLHSAFRKAGKRLVCVSLSKKLQDALNTAIKTDDESFLATLEGVSGYFKSFRMSADPGVNQALL